MPAGGYRANAPLFKPSWRHQGTTTIRVPVVFADLLISIARTLDALDSFKLSTILAPVAKVLRGKFEGETCSEDDLARMLAAEIELYAEPVEVEPENSNKPLDSEGQTRLLQFARQLAEGQRFERATAETINFPWRLCRETVSAVLKLSPLAERQMIARGLIEFLFWSNFHGIAGETRTERDSWSDAYVYLYKQRDYSHLFSEDE